MTSFKPPFWAVNSHAQTILGSLIPSMKRSIAGSDHVVDVPGGDQLFVRHIKGKRPFVVYLWHGLGGNSDTGYMRRTARVCHRHGCHLYQVNHRGCGKGSLLARLPYHSGIYGDLEAVLRYGRQRHPEARHLIIGFSLSGNALLRLLTTPGTDCPDYAISVNAPINLAMASERISNGFFNRIYDLRFVWKIKRSVTRRQAKGILDKSFHIPWLAQLKDIDDLMTAPLSGFRDRMHYYQTCSTYRDLYKIAIPTILITAKDDPIVPFDDYKNARLSPTTQLWAQSHGGHMGYLGRGGLLYRRWLDHAIDEAVAHWTGGQFN